MVGKTLTRNPNNPLVPKSVKITFEQSLFVEKNGYHYSALLRSKIEDLMKHEGIDFKESYKKINDKFNKVLAFLQEKKILDEFLKK